MRYIVPVLGLWILRLLTITYRIRIINEDIEQAIYKRGEYPIYISWHQRFFPGINWFHKRNAIAIMISRSKDGDMIAAIVEKLGWRAIRGSSSRGGTAALIQIKKLKGQGISFGHIVDGPKGPPEIIKPGLVSIAQYSGMPILPTITSAQKRWVFNSWDRFMVPKPFSRVIIHFGKETYVDEKMSEKELEAVRLKVQEQLVSLYKETDDYWKK